MNGIIIKQLKKLRIKDDNISLHTEVKKLTTTKIALEKSIVRLEGQKKEIEEKLIETENIIQSRIDEIWEIKESIDERFKPGDSSKADEIELSPIVVSSQIHKRALEDSSIFIIRIR